MRTIKFLMSAGLALLLALPLTAQNEGQLIDRTFDLSSIAVLMGGNREVQFELPLRASLANENGDSYHSRINGDALDDRSFEPDMIADLARMASIRSMEDEERTLIHLESGVLFARATPEVMSRIEATLKFVEQTMTRNAVVEILLLDPIALKNAPSGILGHAQIAEILKTHKANQRLRCLVNLNQKSRINAARRRQYIRDYDVEVAVEARLADPIVAALMEGIEAGIHVSETIDGRFHIEFSGRTSRRIGSDRVVRQSASGIGALHLPKTESSANAMAATLKVGSGFLVGSHEFGAKPWLIRLRSVDSRPKSKLLQYLSLAALGRPNFSPSIANVVGPRSSGESESRAREDKNEEAECPMPSDLIHDCINELMERSQHENAENIFMEFDNKLYLKIPASALNQAKKILRGRAAPLLRNIASNFRYDLVDNAMVDALLEQTNQEISGTLKRHASLLTRSGSKGVVVSGQEWLSVQDKDVEIARGAQISDPKIDSLFAGATLSVRPVVNLSGHVSSAINFTMQVDTGEGRILDTGIPDIGTIDGDDLSHVSGEVRVTFKPGEWKIVRVAPMPGTDKTFILMAQTQYK